MGCQIWSLVAVRATGRPVQRSFFCLSGRWLIRMESIRLDPTQLNFQICSFNTSCRGGVNWRSCQLRSGAEIEAKDMYEVDRSR